MANRKSAEVTEEVLFSNNDVYYVDKEEGHCIDICVVADHGKLTEKYASQKWASAFAPDTRVLEVDVPSFKRIENISKSKCIRAPVAKKGEHLVMVQCGRDVLPGKARQFILLRHLKKEGEYNLRHLMHNDDDYFNNHEEESDESPLEVEETNEKEAATPAVTVVAVDVTAQPPAPSSPQVSTDGKKSFAAILASPSASSSDFPALPVVRSSTPVEGEKKTEKSGRSKNDILGDLLAAQKAMLALQQQLVRLTEELKATA
jgi:hypothetical protein